MISTKKQKIKQAVILAGGMGMRMRPLTYDRPKIMVPVNGRPFVEYLFDQLKENGIKRVVLLLGYLSEKVVEYVGNGSKFGLNVEYSISKLNDGTATRVKKAEHMLDNEFLLMYCDNYIHLDLNTYLDFHRAGKALATVIVYSNKFGTTKNNVFVDSDGYVLKYDKSRIEPELNGVELGFFLMKKEIIRRMPKRGSFYIDEKIIPELVSERKLRAFVMDDLYHSLSNPERLKYTEKFLSSRKVIFLDRDGVINKKMPKGEYVRAPKEFKFLPGAIKAIKLLSDAGYEIYIISNQAGIGRGLMTEPDLFQIHKYMEGELVKRGAKISGIYYCTHTADDGCFCRKPRPGMLHRAAADHHINLKNVIFIGDDSRDIEAGKSAGWKTILVSKTKGLLDVVSDMFNL